MATQNKYFRNFDLALGHMMDDDGTNDNLDILKIFDICANLRKLLYQSFQSDDDGTIESDNSPLWYYATEARRLMSLIDMIENDALLLSERIKTVREKNRSYRVVE